MRNVCVPKGIANEGLDRLESIIIVARTLKRGDTLFRESDAFTDLYAVHSGTLKTSTKLEDGRHRVTALHLAGDVFGFDGIEDSAYHSAATAVEDSTICMIPYAQLLILCGEIPGMNTRVLKLMSERVVRESTHLMLLGTLNADERLASFLLDISERHRLRGYSPKEFNLRMTRKDIGNYLGLTIETVSRTLSKFQRAGLISVKGKEIKLQNLSALSAM